MRKAHLKLLFITIVCLIITTNIWGQTNYSHTINAQVWSGSGTQTLNAVSWNLTAPEAGYWGYDGTKGQQVGSAGNPATSITLKTSDFTGTIAVVKISTSGANSINAIVAVSVGGVVWGTPKSITSSNAEYTFTGDATGEIVISWVNSSTRAIYIKKIDVSSDGEIEGGDDDDDDNGDDDGDDDGGSGGIIDPNVMEYYQPAVGKSEAGLKTALYNIIKGHTNVGYDGLYTVYATSDVTADGKVWDMYSTCTWTPGNKKCGNYSSVCDCYNREHSIPQSWFSERSPMVSDAFHIYPTDGKVNGQRSNYPFGECSGGTSLGGNALGKLGNSTFSGYSGRVFEPVDEYKGDFARTYFYFATRYQDIMTTIGGESFNNTTYPSLSEWSMNLFLKWHRQDPVSEKETDRNDAVQKHQKNRNPFIDYPELAEYIWGNKKGNAWKTTSGLSEITVEFSIAPNPVRDQLTIKTKEPELTYTIYNLSGQSLQSGTITNGSKSISVDYLQNGMYLIQMQAGTRQAVQRFIVTK